MPVIAYTMTTEAPSPIQNRQKNMITESLFDTERSTTSMLLQSQQGLTLFDSEKECVVDSSDPTFMKSS